MPTGPLALAWALFPHSGVRMSAPSIQPSLQHSFAKVPAVTLGFWLIKILATTTVGTTLADLCDRSLGIGYLGGSTLLFVLLMGAILVWHRTLGSVSINRLDTRQAELFYWVTILFSQTLGTALGDWVADPATGWGFGYGGGAALFAAGLAVVIGLYFWTAVSRTALFWAAFILTRPLGATVGDFLDKPVANGGLALSRYTASGALIVCILLLVLFLPQRAERLAPVVHD